MVRKVFLFLPHTTFIFFHSAELCGVAEKKFWQEDKQTAITVSPRLRQIITQLLQLEYENNEMHEKSTVHLNQQLIAKSMELRALQSQYDKVIDDLSRETKDFKSILDEKAQQIAALSARSLKAENELEFHKKNSEILKEKVNTLTNELNCMKKSQTRMTNFIDSDEITEFNRNVFGSIGNEINGDRRQQNLNIIIPNPPPVSGKIDSLCGEVPVNTAEIMDINKHQINCDSLSMDLALGKLANFSSAVYTDNFIAQELRDSLISSAKTSSPPPLISNPALNGQGSLLMDFSVPQSGNGNRNLVQKTIQRQSNYHSPSATSPDSKSIDTGNTTKSATSDLLDEYRDFPSFFSTPPSNSHNESNGLHHNFGSMSPFAGLFGTDSNVHGRDDSTSHRGSPILLPAASPSDKDHLELGLGGGSNSGANGTNRKPLYQSSSHSANGIPARSGVFQHSSTRSNGYNNTFSNESQTTNLFASSTNYQSNASANSPVAPNNNNPSAEYSKRPCMFHLSEIWGLCGVDGKQLACKYRNRCFDMHKPLLLRKGYKKADIVPFIDKFNLVNKADAHRCLREDEDFLEGPATDFSAMNGGTPSAGSPANGSVYTGLGESKKGFRCCVPNLVHLWGLKYPDGNVISDCHSPTGQCQHLHKAELIKQGMYTRTNVVGALHIYYAKNKDRLPDVLRALDSDKDLQPDLPASA